MASAFGESVLRLDQSMNVMLLLTVNVVAIPMTIVFGKLADIKGTKFALMLALIIYCFVAVTAAGLAPLELEGEEDAERYDFSFTWNNETGTYDMATLYDRGYENWISEDSEGDAAFRDNFTAYFPEPDYSVGDAGSSTIGAGIMVCIFILVMLALLGGGMMWIQDKEMGWLGIIAAILLVAAGIFGASLLADQATIEAVSYTHLTLPTKA